MFFKKKEKQNKHRKLPKWLPVWLDTPIRFLFRLTLASLIIILCVCAFYWHKASKYDLDKFAEMPARTVVLDKYGEEYATLDGQSRRLVTYEEIPQHLLAALYAREDEDFETHHGVKFTALARATLRNIRDFKYTQGASTLSMQLVKNTYDNREKSIHRKLLEIALTFRLEANYEKSEIVTHYLNRIYFGSGCYGVEEAALNYFGKSTKDLSINESAMLVGLIRGPSIFNPHASYKKAIVQRNEVLDRMQACNSLTEEQVSKLKKQPTTIAKTEDNSQSTNSYTLQTIKRHIVAIGKIKGLDGDDFSELKKNGLTIKTTIDPALVAQIDQAHKNLPLGQPSVYSTAGVILNSKTGAILAVNGGVDSKKYPFNLGLDSKFPLGKTFHSIVYLAALEAGQNPILGHPVQTGRQITKEEVIDLAKRLGLDGNLPEDESLFRGNTSASPLRVATAFAAFSNKGAVPHTYIIDSISSQDGKLLYEHPKKSEQIAMAGNIEEIFKLYKVGKDQTLRLSSVDMDKGWAISSGPTLTSVIWAGKTKNDSSNLDEAKLLKQLQQVSKSLEGHQ